MNYPGSLCLLLGFQFLPYSLILRGMQLSEVHMYALEKYIVESVLQVSGLKIVVYFGCN